LSYPNILSPGRVVHAGGWNAIFGNEHPLNLEIGIGGGEFLLALAASAPEENFVGLDIAGFFLRKAAKKAAKQGITNVRFLVADAKACLYEIFAHESLQAVYINFPDPWPKKGHEKRRHFDEFFMNLLEDRLTVGGMIYLATDVEEYAEQAYEAISQSELFENAYPQRWLNDRGWPELQTRYERKWTEQGKKLFYLAFRKARGLRTPRYDLGLEPFQPFRLGGVTLPELEERLKGRIYSEGKYLQKVLSAKAGDGALRSKILLVDKSLGFKDYLHGVFRTQGEEVVFDLENPADVVYTESKRRAMARFFDHLVE
jgi:tRNA (guanine-N7-)-methyltransferase